MSKPHRWTSEEARAARARRGSLTPLGLERAREGGRKGGQISRFKVARERLTELQIESRKS